MSKRHAGGGMGAVARTTYEFRCYDRRGRLRWREVVPNRVMTSGLNKLLDATLKTGLASPAWYVGLVDNAGFTAFAAADTMASHAGWDEFTAYDETDRPDFTPGAIAGGSVDNTGSRAAFTINASGTLRGGFLADDDTVGGTTGTLYGAASFSAPRAVFDEDELLVKITASIASS